MGLVKISLLLYYFSVAGALPARVFERAVTTPDNTCGPSSVGGYTCNPEKPYGGACCSSSGYCGYTDAYCGTGCQGAYGSCFRPYPFSPAAIWNGKAWNVAGVGEFRNEKTFTFGATLPSGLVPNYDYIPTSESGPPCGRNFTSAGVVLGGNVLKLRVPGGQKCTKSIPLIGGGVNTNITNIKYASVRTTAMLSEVAGTCNGFFFYKNDTQEMDIEFISNKTLPWNQPVGSRPMLYTNHGVNATLDGAKSIHDTAPSFANATRAFHEYRTDWIPGKTIYYLDGVPQKIFTTHVPTAPGTWMWNNWGNGDPLWTGAPPTTDSILTIQRIIMYYNTSNT